MRAVFIIIPVVAAIAVLVLPYSVMAFSYDDLEKEVKEGKWNVDLGSRQKVFDFLAKNVLTVVRTIFWILVVIMIFFTAYMYLSAGANEANLKKANQMLKMTVVAIIVALLSTALPFLIKAFLSPS